MPTVTALRPTRREGRVAVHVDGRFVAAVGESLVVAPRPVRGPRAERRPALRAARRRRRRPHPRRRLPPARPPGALAGRAGRAAAGQGPRRAGRPGRPRQARPAKACSTTRPSPAPSSPTSAASRAGAPAASPASSTGWASPPPSSGRVLPAVRRGDRRRARAGPRRPRAARARAAAARARPASAPSSSWCGAATRTAVAYRARPRVVRRARPIDSLFRPTLQSEARAACSLTLDVTYLWHLKAMHSGRRRPACRTSDVGAFHHVGIDLRTSWLHRSRTSHVSERKRSHAVAWSCQTTTGALARAGQVARLFCLLADDQ